MDTMVLVFSVEPAGSMFFAPRHGPDLSGGIWCFNEPRGPVPCTPLTQPKFGRVGQDVLPGSYSKFYSPIGEYLFIKFAKP